MSLTQTPLYDIKWMMETLPGVSQTGQLKMCNYPQVTKVNLRLKQGRLHKIYLLYLNNNK